MAYRTTQEMVERKAAKRRHIMETAAVVFSEKGYGNTSMKEILAAAGVSAGSFYFYFTGKGQLFEAIYFEMDILYTNIINDAIRDIFTKPVESMCRAITLLLWSFQKKRDLARIMLISSAGVSPEFDRKLAANYRKYFASLEDTFSKLADKGIIDVPDIKVSALSFINSVYAVITEWLCEEERKPSPVDYAYPLVIHNLRSLNIRFTDTEVRNAINSILAKSYEEWVESISK